MKKFLSGFLILAVATYLAYGRAIYVRTFRELYQKSDIIVVGKPVSTKDTAEQTVLHGISPDVHVLGLSSEFDVIFVLKGDSSLKDLVVHHYRLANPNLGIGSGPELASFDPTESRRYLLFLQRESDGRYAPIDQVDPTWTSIMRLNGTEWDRMELQDYRDWLDAKKWLDQRPDLARTMTPAIPAYGRGEGSLHEAALNGKLEKARALIKANPDLVFSQESSAGETPLHLAAEFGNKEVAELLLANNANIEARASGDWTPLLRAVSGGHKELVELLVANKAEVNVKEQTGRTPLHLAAERGDKAITALLLAGKAQLNDQTGDGDTPLHVAAAFGHKNLVELLLANKAEINTRDKNGKTPLALALRNNYNDLTALLRQHGGVE